MDVHLEELGLSSATTIRVSDELPAQSSPRFSVRDKITFFSSLSRLLQGGVPLLRAIELMTRQMKSGGLAGASLRIISLIREGRSLSQAMSVFPGVFTAFEIGVTKTGEISGALSKSLSRISEELKRQEEIKRKIWEAASYPLFVLGMGLVTLSVVLLFVIPRLALIYQDFQGKLPAVTSLVIRIGNVAPYFLAAALLSTVITAFYISRKGWITFLEGIPFVKGLAKTVYLARTSFLMSTLLHSGVPISETLLICSESFPQKKESLKKMLSAVSQGQSVSQSLNHLGFFGENERSLVLASEESGSLAEALSDIAESASTDLTSKVNTLIKTLEPVLILSIGLVVGFLVMAMLLPITEIDMLVQH